MSKLSKSHPPLVWLESGQAFAPIELAWGKESDAPGLLCAGGDLAVDTLHRAYQQGIFPWFSQGQPILWWSPDPRMVLKVADFRLHPSFIKQLKKFIHSPACDIRVNSAFDEVITACANSNRSGQAGTWIVPAMVQAYKQLHRAGFAHSVEAWVDGQLIGGLYFVALGRCVFGESMFHRASNGSKIALAALVAMCRQFGVNQIDCQQNTQHLASLGAAEISREHFSKQLVNAMQEPGPAWSFSPAYWANILTLAQKQV